MNPSLKLQNRRNAILFIESPRSFASRRQRSAIPRAEFPFGLTNPPVQFSHGTIFARRRMSLPVNNVSDSEQSEDYCKSEIIFPRRPPRGVEKSSDSFELSPQVFTEMMDVPLILNNFRISFC